MKQHAALQPFIERNTAIKEVIDNPKIEDAVKSEILQKIIILLRGLVGYFQSHPAPDQVFFVTVDQMPFYKENDARAHSKSCEVPEVYEVHREDMLAVEGVTLVQDDAGKSVEDYKGKEWTNAALKAEVARRQLPVDPKAKKNQVFIDLLVADDVQKAAEESEEPSEGSSEE